MFEYIHNMTKIPSTECTRKCARPCTEHKDITCQQVLGSSISVKNLASCWASSAKEFTIAYSYLLNNFASTAQFTPEEFDAYRAGLMETIRFMQACLEEISIAQDKNNV